MQEHDEHADPVPADDGPGSHDTGVTAHVEEAAGGGHDEGPQVIDLSVPMFFWTLGTFLAMAYILKRIAWRPILEALDKRETYLRESVENAQKVEQELAAIDSQRQETIAGADEKAKDIVSRARKAGLEAERVINEKAKADATILMENAEREINAAHKKAQADLRRESVDLAITLAGKLVTENLDSDKNRELTEKLIEQI